MNYEEGSYKDSKILGKRIAIDITIRSCIVLKIGLNGEALAILSPNLLCKVNI